MIRLATSLAVTRRKESSESSEGLMYSANPFSLGPIRREGTGNIRGEERESAGGSDGRERSSSILPGSELRSLQDHRRIHETRRHALR